MLKLVVLALILTNSQAHFQLRAPRLDGRIIGGTPADITEAPYQVALLLDWFGIGLFFQTCGGSIIADNVIVSAAHCPYGTQTTAWQIRAGSTFCEEGGQLTTPLKFVIHPNFDDVKLDYDISLIFLTSPIIIDNIKTALVPLPLQGELVDDGADALVTGWGSTYEEGAAVDELLKVNIPIVNQDVCVNAYLNINPVTERMLCAGYLDTGGHDACQGDSGGPLTVDGVLIGITSWGVGCGRAGYPGVWTSVSSLRSWIDSEL